MSFPYNEIFQFPERCLLNKRLTKAFFLKNFDLKSSEKNLLNNMVNGMEWIASVKPANANIPSVKTKTHAFEEIQLMSVTLPNDKFEANFKKAADLLQKYIPYQMMVIVESESEFVLNVCDKRINLNDSSKRTIENQFTTSIISKLYKNDIVADFFDAIGFIQLDKKNLQTCYQYYLQAVIQLEASSITGTFQKRTKARSDEDMAFLVDIDNTEIEISVLQNELKKQSQLKDKVSLNVEIQKKRTKIQYIKDKLKTT